MSSDQCKREDDLTSDVVEFTAAESSSINIESQLLHTQLGTPNLGAKVIQDGPYIGMEMGTREERDPYISTFFGMTPEQAREIAAALETAADDAEKRREELAEGSREDADSFLARVRGVLDA